MNMRLPDLHQETTLAIPLADMETITAAASVAGYSIPDFCVVAIYLMARQTAVERQFPPVFAQRYHQANHRSETPVLARGH